MFEDFYLPEFNADYFNSPAFQDAIAAAIGQYFPPVAEPVYYAPSPEPTPTYEYQPPASIENIPQNMVEDYGLIGAITDRFTAPQISAEQLAAERYAADQAAQQAEAQRVAAERYAAEQAAAQAEAQRVAAEQAAAKQAAAQQAAAAAEAQRIAAAQELAARAQAERVAAERAAAAEAAAQRQQTELNEKRAQAAQAAAERAAQERALAEQAAAQAEAQRVAAEQAAAEAAVAPAPEPVYTPAVEPATIEAETVAPLAAPLAAPVETVAPLAAPLAAPVETVAPLAAPLAAPIETATSFAALVATPFAAPVATPFAAPTAVLGRNDEMAVGGIMDDMGFGDYGLGGPMMGAEIVGSNLANTLLGGPELGGSYTGGVGGGPSRTEAERLAAILNVNPYVAPSADMNLDPITSLRSGGQTGYYFANELGLPARFGDVGLPQPANPATFDPNAQYAATAPGFVPVDPNATYRLVEGGTNGDVVYAGEGGEGLRNVFEQANKLTLDDPKNAYWGVEVLDPATGQFERVAENQGPNGLGIVGDIAGVALPVAAAIATGGASLGVQIAAGAAAGGLGGFLAGKDPLTSALIGGATAGLGNVTGANEAIGGVLGNIGDTATNIFASEAAKEAAKQAATSAGGDIVVNALTNLAKGAGAGVLQGAASGLTNNLSQITGYKTPAEKFAEQPVQEPVQQPVQTPVEAAVEPIVVSGTRVPPVVPNYGGALAGVVSPIATEFLPKSVLPEPLPSEPAPADDTIVVTAPKSVLPPSPIFGVETALPAITGGALTAAQTAGTPPPAEKGGVLGTGLTLPQLISIGGIGADLLKNLLAGGGDTGPTTPYVSPFGTGVGFGTGRDMRANPNIIDYERYGFGPEAMFFQPGYGLLNSAAPAPSPAFLPQAQPIMATNPRYEPLI